MEKFEIAVGSTTMADIVEHKISVEDILNSYFNEDDGSRKNEMTAWLESKIDDGVGSPSVHDFEIEGFQDTSPLLGSFNIRFTVHIYFGCDDMNTDREDYYEFHYNVVPKSRSIHCEYKPALWNHSFNME